MTGDTPFRLAKGRVFAALRVVPRAARPGISLGRDSAGGVYVRVQVGAAPDKGRANRAVIKALSKAWGVAPSDLEIVSGETARAKTIESTVSLGRGCASCNNGLSTCPNSAVNGGI